MRAGPPALRWTNCAELLYSEVQTTTSSDTESALDTLFSNMALPVICSRQHHTNTRQSASRQQHQHMQYDVILPCAVSMQPTDDREQSKDCHRQLHSKHTGCPARDCSTVHAMLQAVTPCWLPLPYVRVNGKRKQLWLDAGPEQLARQCSMQGANSESNTAQAFMVLITGRSHDVVLCIGENIDC